MTLVLNEHEMMGASVRQPTSFARVPLDILAGTEPSLRGEDMNSLVDQFVVEMMLNSNGFRAQ